MERRTGIMILMIAAVILLVSLTYTFYTFSISGHAVKNNEIKIGAIIALTGDLATYAEGVNNAISMAIEDSGLKGRVKLVMEDDHGCIATDAVTAAQKLVSIDQVEGIIGPMCSSPLLSTLPITEPQKTIIISPSATSESITGAGNYVFRTIASDVDNSKAIAKFGYDKEYRKGAILYTISDSTIQEKNDVKEEFESLGGKIVDEESFTANSVDFKTQLTKIKNSGADVIFLAAFYQNDAPNILKQAKELGITIPFLGADTALGETVSKLDASLSEGFIFPFAEMPSNKEYANFVNGYKAKFGKEPIAYASEAYDATTLLIKSIDKSDGTKEDIRNKLYQFGQNYAGASGIITFDSNGDVSKPLTIMIIHNGKSEPYS